MDRRSTTNAEAPFPGATAVLVVLVVGATAAVLPHCWAGFPWGDSISLNIFWQESFSEQFWSGEVTPRWLYGYWGGLGAPVFYFYAPFPFYLFSLIDVFPVEQLGDFAVLTVGHALLFFLSGAAFYVLARAHADRFWATVTSLIYMFLPYHYIDIEQRAAMGEACAYIWFPLILAGIWRPDKTWRNTILASCAYAGLILSHLPSALLAAPAIALFAVLSSERSKRWGAVVHALVVGMLGVALSAFYVIPALTLRDTISHDAWVVGQGWHYVATRWLIGSSDLISFGVMIYKRLAAATLLGLASLAVYLVVRKRSPRAALVPRLGLLASAPVAVLFLCWFLMSGLAWPLWEYLPILPQVQFPFRLGVLVDVSSALLLTMCVPPLVGVAVSRFGLVGRHRTAIEVAGSFFAVALLLGAVIVKDFPRVAGPKSEFAATSAPIEYRTKWLVESPPYLGSRTPEDLRNIDLAPAAHAQGVREWEQYVEPLPAIGAMRDAQPGESVGIDSEQIGRFHISAVLDSEATIRVKKVYYPHWRLTSDASEEIDASPDPETGLLVFELPAGRHELTLDRRILPPEKVGLVVSWVTVLAVLVALLALRRRASH